MSFREYHQKIQEAFDTKVDYRIDRETDDRFVTSAIIGERKISFVAAIEDRSQKSWDVYFVQTTPAGKSLSFAATGSGNELEVFSMVKSSMEEFMKKYEPNIVTFTASKLTGSTRGNLYDRMVRKFGGGKYDIARTEVHGDDLFTLTRKE